MVGLAGPAGSTFRLGYGATPTLGMSYTWWEGAGTGWATTLSTALDYEMVGNNDFDITVNLGFSDSSRILRNLKKVFKNPLFLN